MNFAVDEAEQQVIALFELDAQRHIDSSGIEHGQFTDDPHVAAFAEKCHGVAFLNAQCLQSGSEAIDLILYLSISGRFKLFAGLLQQECVVGILVDRRFK